MFKLIKCNLLVDDVNTDLKSFIASAAASIPPPDESVLQMEPPDVKFTPEPFEIFEFGKNVKEDCKADIDEFSSIKYPLVNPDGKSDTFTGDTIQHTRDIQVCSNPEIIRTWGRP